MKPLRTALSTVALITAVSACSSDGLGPSYETGSTVASDSVGKGGGWGGSGHLRADITTDPQPAAGSGWGGSGH